MEWRTLRKIKQSPQHCRVALQSTKQDSVEGLAAHKQPRLGINALFMDVGFVTPHTKHHCWEQGFGRYLLATPGKSAKITHPILQQEGSSTAATLPREQKGEFLSCFAVL